MTTVTTSPKDTARPERARSTRSFLGRYVFPQWLRTVLMAGFWLAIMPFWIGVVSPYSTYSSATTAGVGLVVSSALFVHLWPPRTAPWRTLAWTALLSAVIGSSLLLLGTGSWALRIAVAAGFGFVLLRINQNGRHLWEMFKLWRVLR